MNKNVKKVLIIPLFVMLSLISFGNSPDSIPCQFDVNGYGTIEFNFQNALDSMGLKTDFVTLLPPVYVDSDPLKFQGNGKLFLSLRIMKPLRVRYWIYFLSPKMVKNSSDTLLYSEDHYTTCFLVPNDTLHITIDFSKRKPLPGCFRYAGKWSQLSDYYKNREIHFQNNDFGRIKVRAANLAPDYESFVAIMDSVTQLEVDYFKSYYHKNILPQWFVDFEESDLYYVSYSQKLSEPNLMEAMRGINKPIPKNYYNFLNEHPLNNKAAILSNYYFYFLNFYFQKSQPHFTKSNYKDTNFISHRIVNLIDYSKKNFDSNISDLLLAYMLDAELTQTHVSQKDYNLYTNAIQNADIKRYLELRYINKYVLREGDEAPYFYLKNDKNENISLNSFAGNIVYLTFWFTGCKPCIKEIPDENHLVDVFKNEKVKIVSICMYSSEESWRECIEKYGIKSIPLICRGNWDKLLKEKYDINAFPHHTIIDKHGKIIINKWRNPSSEAEEEIRKCLTKQ
jgi:peroxiredoxin